MRTCGRRIRLCIHRSESQRFLPDAPSNHALQPDKCSTANEQDVSRINSSEFLVRMLASTLRRNICNRALQYLQQCLLHALARNIACDRWVLLLAHDIVDLADVDDALVCPCPIAISCLQPPPTDV